MLQVSAPFEVLELQAQTMCSGGGGSLAAEAPRGESNRESEEN